MRRNKGLWFKCYLTLHIRTKIYFKKTKSQSTFEAFTLHSMSLEKCAEASEETSMSLLKKIQVLCSSKVKNISFIVQSYQPNNTRVKGVVF